MDETLSLREPSDISKKVEIMAIGLVLGAIIGMVSGVYRFCDGGSATPYGWVPQFKHREGSIFLFCAILLSGVGGLIGFILNAPSLDAVMDSQWFRIKALIVINLLGFYAHFQADRLHQPFYHFKKEPVRQVEVAVVVTAFSVANLLIAVPIAVAWENVITETGRTGGLQVCTAVVAVLTLSVAYLQTCHLFAVRIANCSYLEPSLSRTTMLLLVLNGLMIWSAPS